MTGSRVVNCAMQHKCHYGISTDISREEPSMAGPRNPRQILCRFKRLAAPTGRQVKAATLRWASKFKSGGRVAGDTRLWAHFAAQRRQLGREPGPLALVSSASLVHAAASSAQGSRGPSASRRQWSACVLYVSASSSKRSASFWFMAEVSQRRPPPALTLGYGSSVVKGLAWVRRARPPLWRRRSV